MKNSKHFFQQCNGVIKKSRIGKHNRLFVVETLSSCREWIKNLHTVFLSFK